MLQFWRVKILCVTFSGSPNNTFNCSQFNTSLEYVREVSEVEHVVELDGGGQKTTAYSGVEVQGALDHHGSYFHHTLASRDALEMLGEDRTVYGSQGFLGGEADCEHAEVSLVIKHGCNFA